MTEQEILNQGEWKQDSFVLMIASEVFGKTIPIDISFDRGEDRKLSSSSIGAINDFLKLTSHDFQQIEDCIWNHCLACNQSQTSKGSSDGGKTWVDTSTTLEENLNQWGIKTKEDALNKSSIDSVWLSNTWGKGVIANNFSIGVSVIWDNEHGMNIVYRNGVIDDVE